MMLVVTTAVSATNIFQEKDIQTSVPGDVFPKHYTRGSNWGVDQKQTWDDGYGLQLIPPNSFAQSFTPTKDTLTAISMEMFRAGNPPEPVEITVSIRDNIIGTDLVTIIKDTSVNPIERVARWVLFDFEDISVTPGSTYYIVVSANAGKLGHSYCWVFSSVDDLYTKGQAWSKENGTANWVKWLQNAYYPKDFCFKTYFKKPLDSLILKNNENLINLGVLSIVEQFPHMFPILRPRLEY